MSKRRKRDARRKNSASMAFSLIPQAAIWQLCATLWMSGSRLPLRRRRRVSLLRQLSSTPTDWSPPPAARGPEQNFLPADQPEMELFILCFRRSLLCACLLPSVLCYSPHSHAHRGWLGGLEEGEGEGEAVDRPVRGSVKNSIRSWCRSEERETREERTLPRWRFR